MPSTRSALTKDVGARPFKPPPYNQVRIGLLAQGDHAHPPIKRLNSAAFHNRFESARSEARTLIALSAIGADKHGGSARRPAKPSQKLAQSRADTTVAGGGNEIVAAMRVLVVEDDAVIGLLLAEMLVGMGHDVCAIEATEADAVSAAGRCKPDLMIVDVGLGEGSGLSAVDTIYRSGPIPHVFVSGDVSKVRALRPSSNFIQKPYREADLARVIQQALDAVPLH